MLGAAGTLVGFFFFQAEDGIRDRTVTGVQTCALPISGFRRVCLCRAPSREGCDPAEVRCVNHQNERPPEIGRASCKGKSVDIGGRRIVKKKKNRRKSKKRHEEDGTGQYVGYDAKLAAS